MTLLKALLTHGTLWFAQPNSKALLAQAVNARWSETPEIHQACCNIIEHLREHLNRAYPTRELSLTLSDMYHINPGIDPINVVEAVQFLSQFINHHEPTVPLFEVQFSYTPAKPAGRSAPDGTEMTRLFNLEDYRHFRKSGRLVDPDTGHRVSNFDDHLVVILKPTDYAKSLLAA